MPRILLDPHVTEAAMRPSTTPSRYRWSRRHEAPATVASVVSAAPVTHRPSVTIPVAKRSAVAELLHRDEFPAARARFEAEHPPARTGGPFRPVPGGRRAPAVLAQLRAETGGTRPARPAAAPAPVRPVSQPADDMLVTAARIAGWLTARPELGDRHDVAMLLAPLAEMLAEVSL